MWIIWLLIAVVVFSGVGYLCYRFPGFRSGLIYVIRQIFVGIRIVTRWIFRLLRDIVLGIFSVLRAFAAQDNRKIIASIAILIGGVVGYKFLARQQEDYIFLDRWSKDFFLLVALLVIIAGVVFPLILKKKH